MGTLTQGHTAKVSASPRVLTATPLPRLNGCLDTEQSQRALSSRELGNPPTHAGGPFRSEPGEF